jgi:hypothetical protein
MRASLLGLTLLACTTLACGREPSDGQAESTSNSKTEAEAEGPHAFDPEARGTPRKAAIELLDAGAEPREPLRFGERAPSRTLELSTTSTVGDQPIEGPMLVLRIAWAGLEPEGEQRRHLFEVREVVGGWVVEGMGIPELPQQDRVAQSLRMSYERVAGQATGTSMGLDEVVQTRGLSMKPDPAMQLQVFAVPLPSEAIGIGATWTRTERDEQVVGSLRKKPDDPDREGPEMPKLLPERTHEPHLENLAFTDVERFTLVAREGDTLTIDYARTIQSEDPAQVPGTTMSGQLQVSLSDGLARSGSIEELTGVAFPEIDGEPQGVAQFRQTVELRSVD